MTNNNGFWIGRLDLLTLLLQSLLIKINLQQPTINLQPNSATLTAEDSLRFRSHSTTDCSYNSHSLWPFSKVKVKVTLRLTVSQSVSFGVEPHLWLMTGYLLLFDSYGLVLWGALSEERTGLSFIYATGPRQRSLSRVRVPWDLGLTPPKTLS
jgi:hypothetical protein